MAEISVVIITYKRPIEILKRAVKSVLNQSFSDIEILVVNDAPEEEELNSAIIDMLESFHDIRIRYISYDKNHGSNYARNFGLSLSTGYYLAYLDDDDEWLPDKLERQLEVMKKDSNLALVACGFNILNEKGKCGEKKTFSDNSLGRLLQDNYIGGTSFPLLNRKYVVNAGGFDETMTSCQEYDLWIRLREKHSFDCVHLALGNYYVSSDSVYRKNHDNFYQGDQRILKKYAHLFSQNRKDWNIHLNNMSFYFITQRRFKRYWEYKLKAMQVRFFSMANFTLIYKLINKGKDSR